MKIVLTSVLVDDQERALRFYRDILGFQLKHDIPLGAHRWLTVVSPSNPMGSNWFWSPMNIRLRNHSSRRSSPMEFPARHSALRTCEGSTNG